MSRLRDPERFDALIAQPLVPPAVLLPHSPLGRRYYTAVRGDDFVDDSLLIEDEGRALLVAECDVQGEVLGRFGYPVELRAAPELADAACRQATGDLVGALFALVKDRGATQLAMRLRGGPPIVERLTSLLHGRGATARIELRAVIDLSQDDEALLAQMSTHHRRHTRWGKANLTVTSVRAASPDRESFERYRMFHAEVAGRVTRPPASWEVMFEAIAAGRGELVLAHLGDRLVGGCLVLDGGEVSTYASGVYDRTLFEKPLGHYPIYRAICNARARGQRWFDVGRVPLAGAATDKEVKIGAFKQGFTSGMRADIVWQVAASPCAA